MLANLNRVTLRISFPRTSVDKRAVSDDHTEVTVLLLLRPSRMHLFCFTETAEKISFDLRWIQKKAFFSVIRDVNSTDCTRLRCKVRGRKVVTPVNLIQVCPFEWPDFRLACIMQHWGFNLDASLIVGTEALPITGHTLTINVLRTAPVKNEAEIFSF